MNRSFRNALLYMSVSALALTAKAQPGISAGKKPADTTQGPKTDTLARPTVVTPSDLVTDTTLTKLSGFHNVTKVNDPKTSTLLLKMVPDKKFPNGTSVTVDRLAGHAHDKKDKKKKNANQQQLISQDVVIETADRRVSLRYSSLGDKYDDEKPTVSVTYENLKTGEEWYAADEMMFNQNLWFSSDNLKASFVESQNAIALAAGKNPDLAMDRVKADYGHMSSKGPKYTTLKEDKQKAADEAADKKAQADYYKNHFDKELETTGKHWRMTGDIQHNEDGTYTLTYTDDYEYDKHNSRPKYHMEYKITRRPKDEDHLREKDPITQLRMRATTFDHVGDTTGNKAGEELNVVAYLFGQESIVQLQRVSHVKDKNGKMTDKVIVDKKMPRQTSKKAQEWLEGIRDAAFSGYRDGTSYVIDGLKIN